MTGSQSRPVAADGSTATAPNNRDDSPVQQVGDGDPRHGSYSIPWLPEDIWCHIHSLMPMRDAARAACLSRAFLRSWRCRPNLTLNWVTLRDAPAEMLIDRILRNHTGGLKTLFLDLDDFHFSERAFDLDDAYGTFPYVDSWLQVAVTPGIEGLSLYLHEEYNFPCSLLSGVGNTIQDLQLDRCIFRPTSELGPLRRLTNLELRSVHVTGVALECLLSNCLALEQLELGDCMGIIFLKIPRVLQQLSRLTVICCRLHEIDCKAPNLSFFYYHGAKIKLSLGQQLQMKTFYMYYPDVVNELPSIMPNLETIHIGSDSDEVINPPMLLTKFLYLKHISIQIWIRTYAAAPPYDYFSLVSFFDASPCLETLFLDVPLGHTVHESVFGGSSHLRQLPEHRHECLKSVKIVGFNSAKALVELTCCIINNAISLECLTLDTLRGGIGFSRCLGKANRFCWPTIGNDVLKEAFRAALAIRMYIKDKVAPTVKLTVLEPCTRCHSIPVDDK